MSKDEIKLKSKLVDKIQEWIDKESETSEWANTSICIHDECSGHMADAAWAVFEAMYTSQIHKDNND